MIANDNKLFAKVGVYVAVAVVVTLIGMLALAGLSM